MTPPILPQLFNSYVEIHTVQLGVLVGLFFGLLHREYPRAAYALVFCSVVFAFGNGTHIGYAAIDRKPWYFLSGLYVSTVSNLLLVKYAPVLKTRVRSAVAAVTRHGTADDVVGSEDSL